MQALLLVLRNHLFQILYTGVGVIFAAGTILTGRHMLPETDERLYEDALSIGLEMDTLGFQGYRPEKYKVRIFDGTYDFVLYDGNMTRENAAFPALAATAQEVDGEMQVIVPVYDSKPDRHRRHCRRCGTRRNIVSDGALYRRRSRCDDLA